jgi:hypothetical protein
MMRAVALLIFSLLGAVAHASPDRFSVYCTSNFDGTGECRRADTNESLACIMLPGAIIECRDSQDKDYECVQYGAIVSGQSEFYCIPDVKKAGEKPAAPLDTNTIPSNADEPPPQESLGDGFERAF